MSTKNISNKFKIILTRPGPHHEFISIVQYNVISLINEQYDMLTGQLKEERQALC